MFFLRLSTLSLIFGIDAIWALAERHNMYMLKPTGGVGLLVDAISLVLAAAHSSIRPADRGFVRA